MICDNILIQCKSMEININLCISSQLPPALDFLYPESLPKLPLGLFVRLHLETFKTSVSVIAALMRVLVKYIQLSLSLGLKSPAAY